MALRPTGENEGATTGVDISPDAQVIEAGGGDSVELPDGFTFADAEFHQAGPDLILEAPDGSQVVVKDFYGTETPPNIMTPDGGQLDGSTAVRLASVNAPTQVAQAGPGGDAQPIGQVESISGTVTAIRADGSRVELQVGDAVFQGDVIQSSDDGALGVVLADETTFSMAENGRMVLDEMVYDPSTQEGNISMSVLEGVFTFVSGQVAKVDPDAMTLKTPVATIGIRGTQVGIDLTGGENGDEPMKVVLMEESDGFVGEVVITNAGGVQILNLPDQGAFVQSANEPPTEPRVFDRSEVSESFKGALSNLPTDVGTGNDYNVNDDDADGGDEEEGDGEEAEAEESPEEEIDTAAGEEQTEEVAEGEGEEEQTEEVAEGEGEEAGEEEFAAEAVAEEGGEEAEFETASGDGEEGGEEEFATESGGNDEEEAAFETASGDGEEGGEEEFATETAQGEDEDTGGDSPEDEIETAAGDDGGGDDGGGDDGDIQVTGGEDVTTGQTVALDDTVPPPPPPPPPPAGDDGPDDDDDVDDEVVEPAANVAPTVSGAVDLSDMDEDGDAITISEAQLLANASDSDGGTLSIQGLSASSGTLTDNNDGTWDYTPDPDFNGDVTFSYSVSDGEDTVAATASLTVNPVNDAPVPENFVQFSNILEDGSATLSEANLLLGTTDVDGDDLSVQNVTANAGTVTDNGDGTWTYTPDPDFNGDVTFSYDVSDGTVVVANVNGAGVTVEAFNDAPEATDATLNITEDVVKEFQVTDLVGDLTDADGETLSVTFDQPANGSISYDEETGVVTYTPDANYNGPDSFTYTLSDGTASHAFTTNDSVSEAQSIARSDFGPESEGDDPTVRIEGHVDDNDDMDFFSFELQDGEVLSFNIDYGMTGADNVDTMIWIYDENGDVVGSLDDTNESFDPAGTFSPTEGGTYTIAVQSFPWDEVQTQWVENNDGTVTITEDQLQLAGGNLNDDLSVANVDVDDGQIVNNGDGTWTFTPDEEFSGTIEISYDFVDGEGEITDSHETNLPIGESVEFAYADRASGDYVLELGVTPTETSSGFGTEPQTISDIEMAIDMATVTVDVAAVNDAPEFDGADLSTATDEEAAFNLDVSGNFTDVDTGDSLTFTATLADGSALPAWLSFNTETAQFSGTPDDEDVGDISITVTATDLGGLSDSTTFTVSVEPTNDAPVASADFGATDQDNSVSVNVLANDTDVDNAPEDLSVTSVQIVDAQGNPVTGQGSASIDPVTGEVVFNPGDDFDDLELNATEDVIISYVVSDGQGGTDTSTLTVTVTGTNDGPTANVDTAGTDQDSSVSIDVLANDTDPDLGDSLSIQSVSITDGNGNPVTGQGTVSIVNGEVVFNPGDDFVDLELNATENVTIEYTIVDEHGATSSSTATVTVTGTNDGPTANADTAGTDQDSSVSIDVLANDTDPDLGDSLSIQSVSITDGNGNPVTGQGTVSIVNGEVVFNPGSDFVDLELNATENVTIEYTIVDEHGATSSSTATVTVTGTNDGPTANVDTAGTDQDSSVSIDVLANDTDPDLGDSLSIQSVSITDGNGNPVTGQGTVSIVNGEVVFNPGSDFVDLELNATENVTIEYTIVDEHGATSSSTATVTVTGTNDGPTANVDTAGTDQDSSVSIDVLANDTDPDLGDSLSIQSVSITDGNGNPVTGQGTVSIVNGEVVFNPGSDFVDLELNATENVTIEYTIVDEHGATSSSTATVTVTGTNDGPTANADTAGTDQDSSVSIDVLANDTDPDLGDSLSIQSVSITDGNGNPVTGQGTVSIVNGEVVFNPGSDFVDLELNATENVTIEYTIVDEHGATDTSTLTVTVTGTNDGPTANVDTAGTDQDSSVSIDVLANDTDPDLGDSLSIQSVSITDGNGNPVTGQGTVSIVNGEVVFNPGDDFVDLELNATENVTIEYTIVDEHGATSSSTATVTVTGTNDGPTANADTAGTDQDSSVSIDVLANDTDPDLGDSLSIQSVSITDGNGNPVTGQGTVSIVNGEVVFNPGSDFVDLELNATENVTIEYTIVDEHGATSSSTATVTVTGTNDGPTANVDTAGTDQDSSVSIDVLANDTDPDLGDSLSIQSVSITDGNGNPVTGQGTVSIVNGEVVFNPGSDFVDLELNATENVTIEYTIVDEHGATSSSTATVTVTGTNDGPTANADTAGTDQDSTVSIDVLANDTDPDLGDSLSIQSVQITDGNGNPVTGQGTVSIVNGEVVFNPGSDFVDLELNATENVTIEYTIVDEHGATSSSTATVTVTGTNDGPTANVDTAATTENAAINIDVLANDTDPDLGDTLSVQSVQIVDAQGNPVTGQGTATIDPVTGEVTFNPGADFDDLAQNATEDVIISYTIVDEHGATSSSTATVTVTGTNDGPQSSHVTLDGADEDETILITEAELLANATDVDNPEDLTVENLQADGGTLVNNNDGTWSFTPADDYEGVVNFTYNVSDGIDFTQGTASVTFDGLNDEPEVELHGGPNSFTEGDDPVKIAPGASITDVDSENFDGGTLTVSIDGATSDDILSFSNGSVTVTGNELFNAQGDLIGTFTGGDAGSDLVVTFTAEATPADAEKVLKQVTFENDSEDPVEGDRTFEVTVTDGDGGTSDVESTTITVNAVNDDPDAVDDVGSVIQDGSVTVNVLANDTDVDNEPEELNLTNAQIAGGAGGVVSIVDNEIKFETGDDFDYLPAGEQAQVSINYTVSDGAGGTDTATLVVTITGTNDGAEISGTTAGGVTEDSNVSEAGFLETEGLLSVTDADTGEAEFQPLTNVTNEGGYGSFSITAGGSWTYSADNSQDAIQSLPAGETLTETFTVFSEDGSDSELVTITITGTNDAPTITGESAGSVTEDTDLSFTGQLNITDVDTGEDVFQATDPAAPIDGAYGSLTIDADGTWTYNLDNSDPAVQALGANDTVNDYIDVVSADGTLHQISITINGTNDTPEIGGVTTGTVTEDGQQTATGSMTITDADTGESSFTAEAGVVGQYGTLDITAAGVWTYTLNNDLEAVQQLGANDELVENVTVTTADGTEQIIQITIDGTNDVPTIVGTGIDDQSINEAQAFELDVSGNFTDIDLGATLTFSATLEDGGDLPDWLSIDPVTGVISGTPGVDDDANLNITVTATDEHQASVSDTFALDVTDTQVGDLTLSGPAGGVVNAVETDDAVEIPLGMTATITDDDGGPIETFTDAEIVITFPDGLPLDGDGDPDVSFNLGSFVQVDVDPGEPATLLWTGNTDELNSLTMTVPADWSGDVNFAATGTTNEGGEESTQFAVNVSATEDITITAGDHPFLNEDEGPYDLGLASSAIVIDDADGSETLQTVELTFGNDLPEGFTLTSDGNSVPMTYDAEAGTYTVDATSYDLSTLSIDTPENWNGTVDATVNATSNEGSEAESFTLTINPVNDDPSAVDDATGTTENASVSFDVLANDTDVDNAPEDLSVTAVQIVDAQGNPVRTGQGSVSIDPATGEVVFNPGTDFDDLELNATEEVLISYTVSDGAGGSDTATLTVTVTGTNDGPTAVADTAGTDQDSSVSIDVLANDTDPDLGDSLSIQSVSITDGNGNPVTGQGTVSIVNGEVVFNPGSDFVDLELNATENVTIEYTIVDEHGATSSSTATVTVTGTNDGPTAVADTAGTDQDSTVSIDVLANDTDPDLGDSLSIQSVSITDGNGNPVTGQGSVSIVNGEVVFNPGDDFVDLELNATENVTIEYTIVDEHGATSSSTATVTVTGTNDGPTANADTAETQQDSAINIDVLANDTDPDLGDSLSVQSVQIVDGQGNPVTGQGTVSIDPTTGEVVFTTGNDFDDLELDATEDVIISYTIVDEHGATSTSTATVTVKGTNDAPTLEALIDDQNTDEGTAFSLDVSGNFDDADIGDTLTFSATQGDGSPLPSWLSIDPVTGVLSGTPEDGDDGVFDVIVTATDEHQATATDTFQLTVDPTNNNENPVAVNDLELVGEDAGDTVSGNVIDNDSDADGDTLFLTSVEFDGVTYTFPEGEDSMTVEGDHGTLTISTDGSYDYVKNDDEGFSWADGTPTWNDGAGELNPVDQDNLTVPEGSESVTITFQGESAGYHNVFGWYKLDENGNPTEPQIIWENSSAQGSGGDLVTGESQVTLEGLEAGEEFGFFLIKDGARDYDWIDGDTQFSFDASGNLVSGDNAVAEADIFHTVDPNLADEDLNVDNIDHATSGINDDGELQIGFEDLWGGGDEDYNDLMFSVSYDGVTSDGGSETVSAGGRQSDADDWADDGVTFLAYNFGTDYTDGDGKFDASTADGDATFTPNGVGVDGNQGGGQAPDQIGYDPDTGESEALAMTFDSPVSEATITIEKLFRSEGGTGETGHWYAYDADGNLVADGELDDHTIDYDAGSNAHTGSFTIGSDDLADGATSFSTVVFVATEIENENSNSASDYHVLSVDYQTYTEPVAEEDVFTYTISDGEGGTATADLTIRVDEENADRELTGGAGDDVLTGGGGDDVLTGDSAAGDVMYVLEEGSDDILKVLPDGSVHTVVTESQIEAATGYSDADLDDRGIAQDDSGNLFFTELDSDSVLMVPADGGDPVVLASRNDIKAATGSSGADPKALTVGSDGTVYVMEDDSDSIISIDPATGTILVVASEDALEAALGTHTSDSDVSIDMDGGIVMDSDGNIYAASDGSPDAIFKINASSGAVIVLATSDDAPFSDLDVYMTLAPNGDLIVADDGTSTIYKVDTTTGDTSTFISNSDLETATGKSSVDLEGGIGFDPDGNFYVAEENTDAIYKFTGYDENAGTIDGSTGAVFVSKDDMKDETGSSPDLEGGIAFGTGGGDDELVGGAGDDTLDGGVGDDTLEGGDDNDILYGGSGVDYLDGGDGGDVIYGDAGNDIIIGGEGNDSLYGGEGADEFQFSLGDGDDTIFDFEEGDELTFDGIGEDQVEITVDGDDVVINVFNQGDDHSTGEAQNTITIKDGAKDYENPQEAIESYTTTDNGDGGTSITIDDTI